MKWLRRLFSPLAFIFIPIPTALLFSQVSWTSFNGPVGGKITAIQIDSSNPDNLFVGTAGGGIFQSTNGGNVWIPKNQGLNCHQILCLAQSSFESVILWTGTKKGLYRSDDFGSTWYVMPFDSLQIHTAQVHPKRTGVIFIGTNRGIFKSEDNGDHWMATSKGLGDSTIHCLLFHASDENKILAGTEKGIYLTEDFGENWVPCGLPTQVIQCLSMHPNSQRTIYVGTRDAGVFRNQGSGNEWQPINRHLSAKNISALKNDPLDSGIIYATTQDGGIFKSKNRGDDWEKLSADIPLAAIHTLVVNPQNTNHLFAGSQNGFYQSHDQGITWTESSEGIIAAKINSVTINHRNSNHIILGLDGEIIKSFNRGQTWQRFQNALVNQDITYMVISPTDTNKIWVGTKHEGVFLSLNGGRTWGKKYLSYEIRKICLDPINSQRLYLVTNIGIYRTDDFGENWTKKNGALPNVQIYDLVINRQNPLELYTATQGNGIYQSSNGGERWFPINFGLDIFNVYALQINESDQSTYLLAGTEKGIYKNNRQGDGWSFVALASHKIIQIKNDPTNPQIIYALSDSGQVFMSSDAGNQWKELPTNEPELRFLTLAPDPIAGGVLLAGSNGKGLFQTRTLAPQITVNPQTLYFDATRVDSTAALPIFIENSGSSNLNIFNIAATDSAFRIGVFNRQIEVAQRDTIIIYFKPDQAKQYQGMIQIHSNDPDLPEITISVEGTGVESQLVLSATHLDFGNVRAQQVASKALTLTNNGTAPLQIFDFIINSTTFSTTTQPTNIDPGESIEVEVTFTPPTTGSFQDSLIIDNDDQLQIVALTGVGIAPELHLSDYAHNFGEVVLNDSLSWQFQVFNKGSVPLLILKLWSEDSYAFTSFVSGDSVQPGASQTITVTFHPYLDRYFSDTLRVETDAGRENVALGGKGIKPDLILSEYEHDFQTIPVGQQSAAWGLTIANPTDLYFKLTRLNVSQPAIFIVNKADSLIRPKRSIQISIRFRPLAAKLYQDSLVVKTAFWDTLVVLTGQGSAAQMVLSDSILDFNAVAAGQSARRTLSIANEGNDTLRIKSLSNQLAQFQIQGQPFVLPPGSKQNVDIRFCPTEGKVYQDTLRIVNMSGSEHVVLLGKGVISILELSHSHYHFGKIRVGKMSPPWKLVLSNRNSFPLRLSKVTFTTPDVFRLNLTDSVIAANDSLNIQVIFQPPAASVYRDSLAIQTAYGDTAVPLEGIGIAPRLVVSDSLYDFGMVKVNRTADFLLTLRNTGNDTLHIYNIITNEPFQGHLNQFVIAPNAAQELKVQFTPIAEKFYHDQLRIISDDGEHSVVLKGRGIRFHLALSDSTHDFGPVELYQRTSWSFHLRNRSVSELTVNSMKMTQGKVFEIEPAAAVIQPDESLHAKVSFVPNDTIIFQDTVKITYATNENFFIPVVGKGCFNEQGPVLIIEPDTLDFKKVRLGATAVGSITVANGGSEDLSLTVDYPDDPAFEVPELLDVLASAQSIVIQILFKPTERRLYEDRLVIETNNNDEIFYLKGFGIAPALFVADSSFTFDNTAVDSSRSVVVTVKNIGNDTLKISAIQAVPNEFSVFPDKALLASGDSIPVTVTFRPESKGKFKGSLVINSNDPDHREYIIDLTGISVGPDVNGPTIIHSPLTLHPKNQPIVISAQITDDYSEVASARLYFRNGGQANFNPAVDLIPGSATIPAPYANIRGVEYYLEATDKAGNQTRLPAQSACFISIVTDAPGECQRDHDDQPVAQPAGNAQTAYRLFSIPLILENPRPLAVLQDELGEYDETRWVFADYNPEAGDASGYVYLNQKDKISDFNPGKAFWLLVNKPGIVIKSGKGRSVVTTEPYLIPLQVGWNLIGAPYAFSIPKAQLQLASGTPFQLFTYQGSWDTAAVIKPWEGYAIHNFQESVDTLKVFPYKEMVLLLAKNAQSEYAINWQLSIEARCQQASDHFNWLGTVNGANSGWNDLNQPEPPFIGEFISLFFRHSEWTKTTSCFTSEFQPYSEKGNSWEFEVVTNICDADVILTFQQLHNIPDTFKILLIDQNRNAVKSLNADLTYRYQVANPNTPRLFKLFIGREDYLKEHEKEIPLLPNSFELTQCYPNPLHSQTVIQYLIPRPGPISLTIFNVQGQTIRAFCENRWHEAGTYLQSWDSRDQNGILVANGIYFYQLKTEHCCLTRKVMIVR